MAFNITVGRLNRTPLRVGKTTIDRADAGGTVVDLDDAVTRRDLARFESRWVVVQDNTNS